MSVKFKTNIEGTALNGITGLASSTPLANGTAAVGTSTAVARQDHVHSLRRTVVSKTTDYTLAAADAGKVILMSLGGIDITIEANVFTAGDEFTIINDTTSTTECLVKVNSNVKMFVMGTKYELGTSNTSFALATKRGIKFTCTTGGASPRFYGWRS